jgi:hypothetical protein
MSLLSSASIALPAAALDTSWVGASFGYDTADHDRGAHHGESVAFDGGFRVFNHLSVEADVNLTNFETGKAGYTDYYRTSFGARALFLPWETGIAPYLAAGAGGVYNNTGHNGVNTYGELTIGVFAPPTPRFGIRWRVELRLLKDNYGVAHDPTDKEILIGAVIPFRGTCVVRCDLGQ